MKNALKIFVSSWLAGFVLAAGVFSNTHAEDAVEMAPSQAAF